MVELFRIREDFLVDINEDWISTIKAFRDILIKPIPNNVDKGKILRSVFTYLYHLSDYRSRYHEYDDEEKLINAKKDSGITDKVIDFYKEEIKIANLKYDEIQNKSKTFRFLKSVGMVLDGASAYYEGVDFTKRDSKGLPVYDLKKELASIKETESALTNYNKILKKYKDEMSQTLSLRGNSEKGHREEPGSSQVPIV